jgi:c-di-GMP-binding flagellar brake protein YcgR
MVPVDVCVDGRVRPAVSVDLSEGGLRCILNGSSASAVEQSGTRLVGAELPHSAAQKGIKVGSVVSLTVDLGEQQVCCEAEVIRGHHREDQRQELSLRFIGLGENREDIIRRYVFAGLRELRNRGLI